MTATKSGLVYLVEDDWSVRGALSRRLRSAGFATRQYGSSDELMDAGICPQQACVVAESLMPGGAGIDLPRRLRE